MHGKYTIWLAFDVLITILPPFVGYLKKEVKYS
jgi:hypothetical protein